MILNKKANWFGYSCMAPGILILLVFQALPLAFALYMSFYDLNLMYNTFAFIGLDNYLQLIKDPVTLIALRNTLIYCFATVSVSLVLGFALALFLNTRFNHAGLVRSLLSMPLILSPIVSATTWAFLFNDQYGFINFILSALGLKPQVWLGDPVLALVVIIITGIWITIPFFFIVLFAGLQSLPAEVYESAQIDGANSLNVFRHLTLPLMLPLIILAVTIQLIDAFRVYDIVYLTTFGGPGRATEVFSTFSYKEAFFFFKMGYGITVAVVATLIVIIMGLILIKLFAKNQTEP
jgi:multiple sugar transport system permease protein